MLSGLFRVQSGGRIIGRATLLCQRTELSTDCTGPTALDDIGRPPRRAIGDLSGLLTSARGTSLAQPHQDFTNHFVPAHSTDRILPGKSERETPCASRKRSRAP